MARTMNTILLKGRGRRDEGKAAAAFSPGNFLEFTSASEYQKNATEGADVNLTIAMEDANQGNTVADAYAADDEASIYHPVPGDEVAAILKAGVNYSVGDTLILDAAGRLIKESEAGTTANVKRRVAELLEAKNLSASSASDELAKVRIL